MHNEFYASGFLYHPPTQQILLQQYVHPENASHFWSLFGGQCKPQEQPKTAFQRIINEATGLTVTEADCYEVYDYFHKRKNVQQYIFYAVVNEIYEEESLLTENKTEWFTFKKITKLDIKPQVRQDITVGQRVINLAIRQLETVSVPES